MRSQLLNALLFLSVSVAISLGGCAGTASNIPPSEPRERRHFDGQPFSVDYVDGLSRERGPSSGLLGDAGRITGVVCGTDVEAGATYQGDRLKLSGFVENQYPMNIEVRELGSEPGIKGFLRFTGSIAYHTVQLDLFGNRLVGWVGHCRYDMRLTTDEVTREAELLQTVKARGFPVRMRLQSFNTLWGFPAAVQAATLPMLVMCVQTKVFENLGQEPPAMSFAGPGTAVPRQTLSFVSRNTLCR